MQRGLASGANETLEFGRFEGAITHFHRQLTELVDSPESGAAEKDRRRPRPTPGPKPRLISSGFGTASSSG